MYIPFSVEPSVISIKAPIQEVDDVRDVPKMPYYTTYLNIDPIQRWVYMNFLQNPYKDIDIGYVFLLYYGLERHLLIGDFEKAFSTILKLRAFHKNASFLAYSSSALILSCLLHKRSDYLSKYLQSIDDSQIPTINVSLFLVCLHTFDLELTPKHLMFFAKKFAFDNSRYIKNNPDIFLNELENAIEQKIKAKTINIQNVVKDIWKVKKTSFELFANMSLRNKDNKLEIPDLTTDIKLTTLCNNVLNIAHDKTKSFLKTLPKDTKHKVKNTKNDNKAVNSISDIPDEIKDREYQFLNAVSCSKDIIQLHFACNNVIEFSYKNREFDYYLQMCVEYCLKDINMFPEFYKEHINKFPTDSGNLDIRLPSFSRLAIIYEKQKEFEKAIEVCELALSYNLLGDFESRLEKLKCKLDVK